MTIVCTLCGGEHRRVYCPCAGSASAFAEEMLEPDRVNRMYAILNAAVERLFADLNSDAERVLVGKFLSMAGMRSLGAVAPHLARNEARELIDEWSLATLNACERDPAYFDHLKRRGEYQ